ncbi:hypothetical protein F4820DRAFT_452423 [Hypoxylon rubiginosum]|uniref:Uncharacterized protein n=1 Tax=Hypoxylon rubiginosum TaxID=110542 RepID=A0ACB9YP11_9PEZI|nr:hypothetical protein F4820DRAFT_452423 [Hypoxylon rubiginosum]
MPYLWGPLRALRLAAVFAATVSATYIQPSTLLSRADETCAADNFTKCTQSGLPDNFCCETGATCLVLAGGTTVLCCPEGNTCGKISAITCDITLQDASTNPAAEIKTTALDSVLETCGSQCCPFGYHCDGTICIKDDDQSKKPDPAPKSTETSTPASTPTPTSDPTSSTTVAVSGVTTAAPSTTETPAPSTESTSNTVKIVGGVIGGVIGLVLVIVAVVLLCFRRKKRRQLEEQKPELQRHNSSTSSFGNIISAPVPHADYPNQRIDFLAKRSQTSGSPRNVGSLASSPGQPPYRHQQQQPQPQPHGSDEEEYELGFGFMPPNSPYSPYSRRPDSTLSDAPRSYHQSAEINGLGGLRSLTSWKPNHQKASADDYLSPAPAPTSRDRRQPSSGSESINVFADPITFGGRPTSTATTWSNIQQRADRNASRRA